MAKRTLPSTYTDKDPYRRLAGAIVLQAALEARHGNPMALAWLGSDDAAIYLDYCRLDSRFVQTWIDQTRLQNAKRKSPSERD